MDFQETTDRTIYTTTKRREWWGWLGSIVWLFFMMYGYPVLMLSDNPDASSSWLPVFFMLVFALSIAMFSWVFGRDPDGLSKIAFITTPIGIVITAVFALLPSTPSVVLYVAAPLFMAPAVTRRVYGVIRTAAPNSRLTRYMSAISVCVALFTVWNILSPPKEIAFLVPALLAVPAWLGVRRSVSLPKDISATERFRFSGKLMFLLAVAAALLLWLDLMNSVIHTVIISTGATDSEIIYTILGFVLPPVGFLLYGIANDRGYERIGFICGMGLLIVGILLALLPSGAQNSALILLSVTDGLGGAYTEFLMLTLPVFFLIGTKRPVFVAALGVVLNLLSSALLWNADLWLPESLLMISAPVLASTAIAAVLFVVLVYFLFERYREKSLAATLYTLLVGKVATEAPATESAPDVSDISDTMGLQQNERRVMALLLEGFTSGEISRNLHMPASDVAKHLRSIRGKIARDSLGELLDHIVATYKLTKRETQILRGIHEGKTNTQIAEENFISDETVKFHVKNLMKKLPVKNRSELRDWLIEFRN